MFERIASKKILFTPLHIHVMHLYKRCSCYSICKFEMLASHFLHNHIWLINSVVKKLMVLPHCPWFFTTALCQTIPHHWFPEAEHTAVYNAKNYTKKLLFKFKMYSHRSSQPSSGLHLNKLIHNKKYLYKKSHTSYCIQIIILKQKGNIYNGNWGLSGVQFGL